MGDLVTAELDGERRYAHLRIHTALHGRSCVVGAPVTGGHIAADQGRLDFAIDMRWLDATRIERELNALLERDVVTETAWITDAELNAQPERVKTDERATTARRGCAGYGFPASTSNPAAAPTSATAPRSVR